MSKHDRLSSELGWDLTPLYFLYDEQASKKLMKFTSNHLGGKLGFVWLGSLNKIYIIDEIIDNGIIEFTSNRIYKVNRQASDREK